MIDLSYLKVTTGNDKTIIKELIQLFVNQLPDLKKKLTEAYNQGNWNELREAAHKAKNSFQIIGAKTQAENLKTMEIIASKSPKQDKLKPLVDDFLDACETIIDEINQLNF